MPWTNLIKCFCLGHGSGKSVKQPGVILEVFIGFVQNKFRHKLVGYQLSCRMTQMREIKRSTVNRGRTIKIAPLCLKKIPNSIHISRADAATQISLNSAQLTHNTANTFLSCYKITKKVRSWPCATRHSEMDRNPANTASSVHNLHAFFKKAWVDKALLLPTFSLSLCMQPQVLLDAHPNGLLSLFHIIALHTSTTLSPIVLAATCQTVYL